MTKGIINSATFGPMIIMIWQTMAVISNESKTEYCQWEEFEASCAEGEVLVITSAKYGRMRLGRCLGRDFGYLGCGSDVLPQLDRQCSGRNSCKFSVATLHDGPHLCPKDLAAYLEVTHKCLEVTPCHRSMCSASDYLQVTSGESSGYLASLVTAAEWCGSSNCPWVISGRPGQRLNLTLIDFSHSLDESRPAGSEHDLCSRFATITEAGGSRDVTSCGSSGGGEVGHGGPWGRERHMFTSSTSSVQIQLYMQGQTEDAPLRFLIKYEAIGCSDIAAPPFAQVSRQGGSLTVECVSSRQIWHLTCKHTTWIGEIGKCEDVEGGPTSEAHGILTNARSSPYGMLIVIGLGVALGVVIGSVMLLFALLCMKRNKSRTAGHNQDSLLRDISPSRDHFTMKSTEMIAVDAGSPGAYYPPQQSCDHNYTSTLHVIRPIHGQNPHPIVEDSSTVVKFATVGREGRDHVYETPRFDGSEGQTQRTQSMDELAGYSVQDVVANN